MDANARAMNSCTYTHAWSFRNMAIYSRIKRRMISKSSTDMAIFDDYLKSWYMGLKNSFLFSSWRKALSFFDAKLACLRKIMSFKVFEVLSPVELLEEESWNFSRISSNFAQKNHQGNQMSRKVCINFQHWTEFLDLKKMSRFWQDLKTCSFCSWAGSGDRE